MASKRRREVIDESKVGAYHCYSKVSRGDFLLGVDPRTGRDNRHRKLTILERLKVLAMVFAVELLDWSVLDNHLHLILRNRPDLVESWTDEECAERWLRLNRAQIQLRGRPKRRRLKALVANRKKMAKIRKRLSSISWYMASLKEALARQFNQEDGVKNCSFWAARFGCVPLEGATSLLACSLYAAMNPERAGIATSVETSEFTSAHARLMDRMSGDPERPESGYMAPVHVDGDGFAGVEAGRRPSDKGYLELTFDEYLDLLDQLMRRERAERAGKYDHPVPSILERLGITSKAWEESVRLTSRRFTRELEEMARVRGGVQPGYKLPIRTM